MRTRGEIDAALKALEVRVTAIEKKLKPTASITVKPRPLKTETPKKKD